MPVLKATEFAQTKSNKRIFSLGDIAAEAKHILDEAHRRRKEILSDAQEEISQARKLAQKEGYRQGHQEGFENGRQEGHQQALKQSQENFDQRTADLIDALRAVWQEFDQAKGQLLFQAEQATVALAVAIARKVVKNAAMVSSDVATENVKTALDMITRNTNVVIKISSQDESHLKEMLDKDQDLLGKFATITFKADPSLSPGSCLLSTEQGQVDTRLDTQIDRIGEDLLITGSDAEQQLTSIFKQPENQETAPK